MATSTMIYKAKRILLALLSNGGKYSVIDIIKQTGCIADPRSEIRHLRNAGVDIRDCWETSASGSRYKVYWMAPGTEQL